MKTVLWWLYCAMLAFVVISALAAFWPLRNVQLISILPALDGMVLIASLLISPLTVWAKSNPGLPAIAVMALVVLFAVRNAPSGTLDDCGTKATVKIMTLNVQQFGNDTARVKRIVQLIRDSDADVVCLQEFGLYYKWPDVVSVANDFASRIGMPHADFTPHPGNIFGTAIFSRYPILGCDTVFQELSRTNEAKMYRLQVAGEELMVANVHLESYNLGNNAAESNTMAFIIKQRLWQARFLQLALQDYAGPTILLGDFNAAPGTLSHQMVASGLNDLQREAGKGWMPTHKWFPVRIDHVLASPDVCLEQLEVDGAYPSDHRAIVAEIAW